MDKDILKNYYDSFINEKDQKFFFTGATDYVKAILEDEDCKKIILGLQRVKEKLFAHKKRLEEKAKVNKRKHLKLSKKFEKLEKSASAINGRNLKKEDGAIIDSIFSLSDSLSDSSDASLKINDKIIRLKEKIEREDKVSAWGAWDRIYLIHAVVFGKREELKHFRKDKNNFWVRELIKDIRGINSYPSSSFSEPPINKYKSYFIRFNNYLLGELGKSRLSDDEGTGRKKSFYILPSNGVYFCNDIAFSYDKKKIYYDNESEGVFRKAINLSKTKNNFMQYLYVNRNDVTTTYKLMKHCGCVIETVRSIKSALTLEIEEKTSITLIVLINRNQNQDGGYRLNPNFEFKKPKKI